jgi:hypothetical protein
MTVGSLGVLEISCDKSELTQKTMLARTIRRGMRLGHFTYGDHVVEGLQNRVDITIEDMSLKAGISRAVVEPDLCLSIWR